MWSRHAAAKVRLQPNKAQRKQMVDNNCSTNYGTSYTWGFSNGGMTWLRLPVCGAWKALPTEATERLYCGDLCPALDVMQLI